MELKRIMSEETKKKISNTLRGRKLPRDTVDKMIKYRTGLRRTDEARKNISLGRKNAVTDEFRKKMSLIRSGKKIGSPSLQARINMSNAKKGKSPKNSINWKGTNHPNWQGGKSFEVYPVDWEKTLRISIRERDCYTCQICGEKQGDEAHSVHHIDYNKKNCSPDNLITLCRKCHCKTNYHRGYWEDYFKAKFNEFNRITKNYR